jgi:hypothetical protein
MGKYIAALCLGLVTAATPARAQFYRDRPARSETSAAALVRSWYRHYLGRDVEPSGLYYWVDQLNNGASPTWALSQILASDEYYARAGKTQEGYVKALFQDVLGRKPTRREYRTWLERLEDQTFQEFTYDFLKRYARRR